MLEKMSDALLHTPRLMLVAATCAHLRAELAASARMAELLDAQLPADWPPRDGEYAEGAMRYFLLRLEQDGEAAHGWYGWYVLSRASAPPTLVACGGYFGPPNKTGEVEIGYSVSAEWRGRGVATELVGALVANAFADARVTRIYARTATTNAASVRVLRQNDFGETPSDEPGYLRFVRER